MANGIHAATHTPGTGLATAEPRPPVVESHDEAERLVADERGDERARTRGREIRPTQTSAPHQFPLLSVVEQLSKEPTAAVSAIIAIVATTVATLVIVAALVWVAALRDRRGLSREEVRSGLGCPLRRGRTRLVCGAPLDDLVEFTPTEPDPSAAGAVVDLDTQAIPHDEIDLAVGAQHAWGSRLRRSHRCVRHGLVLSC